MSKKKIKLEAKAKNDIKKSAKWYEDNQEGLGDDFKEEIKKTVVRIEQNPNQFQKVNQKGNVRRALAERFPYLVFYKIGDVFISIFSVFNASQDPKKWKKRIK